ncbi:Hypothetical protein, putative [Bodo saltans]|uniref:Uncharacterized protein n=1 Tax=Bodo saltans TaxID=75058 RepID=A0A0S4KMY7_BODSA|nr:Hypothetical protein, putative [Bodo saltans]|eukprot:CUI14242.1 Hypothetical protein, putative [Bodo saltans]
MNSPPPSFVLWRLVRRQDPLQFHETQDRAQSTSTLWHQSHSWLTKPAILRDVRPPNSTNVIDWCVLYNCSAPRHGACVAAAPPWCSCVRPLVCSTLSEQELRLRGTGVTRRSTGGFTSDA